MTNMRNIMDTVVFWTLSRVLLFVDARLGRRGSGSLDVG
jgi:hypothetical protein